MGGERLRRAARIRREVAGEEQARRAFDGAGSTTRAFEAVKAEWCRDSGPRRCDGRPPDALRSGEPGRAGA